MAAALFAGLPARAEMSAEELAKLAQNPVGNLISLPFQNNTNLNFGPEKGTQNILNIQPVIPISVNKEWNIITRTILPVISMPSLGPGIDSNDGVGDTVFTAFLSPANPGHGSGAPARSCRFRPTATRSSATRTGASARPSSCCTSSTAIPWVYGVLVNNIWSVTQQQAGRLVQQRPHPAVRQLQLRRTGSTSPPRRSSRSTGTRDSSQQWTVPIGGGVGKIFHLGKLPVNTQLSAYYNVVRPDFGANWQIRVQVQLMFPK